MAIALALEILGGCGGARPALPAAAALPKASAPTFPDDAAPMARYISRRLGLSVALPDGKSWRIDDHSRPELVATHAPTRSKVVIAVFHADEIVGRVQCESLARARKLVPTGDLRTLAEEVTFTQQTFDTRVWVAVEAGGGPDSPLTGHVMAFGGFLRKCFAFIFSTQVDGASDEPVLASRLAFARARLLGALVLDDALQPKVRPAN